MNRITTITAKRQLTIPAVTFTEAGLKIGQKVLVTKSGRGLTVTLLTNLVEELAGSLKTPKRWRGKTTGAIITAAKREHLAQNNNK